MGMIKRYLEQKIIEWQALHPQWSLADIYDNDELYREAVAWAEEELKGGNKCVSS